MLGERGWIAKNMKMFLRNLSYSLSEAIAALNDRDSYWTLQLVDTVVLVAWNKRTYEQALMHEFEVYIDKE